MSNRAGIHKNIFYYLSLALAFFIPVFPAILPIIIGFMFLNWSISTVYLETIPMLYRENRRSRTLLMALLYIMYIVGMFYSDNTQYGWFDLEIKLSLLIFPMVFATTPPGIFSQAKIRILLMTFVGGCLAGALLFLGHAWRSGGEDAYYYSNFSWYFHPSYLAMYYNFAMAVTAFYLAASWEKLTVLIKSAGLVILIFLEFSIFLLSSKAGLLVLALSQLLFVAALVMKRRSWRTIILLTAGMIILFAGLSKVCPYAFYRISRANEMISQPHTVDSDPTDGTVARKEIWKVSIELIREHPVFGVGTGDVKDELVAAYQQHGLVPVVKKRLNAHNQYLQTFVAIGIPGFGLLICMLCIPALLSLRQRNYLFFLFILNFAVNILFESMLENQAGVVFYAFFNVFFFSVCLNESVHTNTIESVNELTTL